MQIYSSNSRPSLQSKIFPFDQIALRYSSTPAPSYLFPTAAALADELSVLCGGLNRRVKPRRSRQTHDHCDRQSEVRQVSSVEQSSFMMRMREEFPIFQIFFFASSIYYNKKGIMSQRRNLHASVRLIGLRMLQLVRAWQGW